MSVRDEDEAAIRGQIERMLGAVREHDLEGARPVYAPGIVSFDVQPPMQHLGADAKMRNWVDVFATFERPLRYEVRDLTITVGEDMAFARGFNRLSGTLRSGPATNGMWVRWTACLQKIDGEWLIVHDHVSTPLDFASGKALVDLEP